MVDYARELYGMISGIGDAYQSGRGQRQNEISSDRDYAAALDQLGWKKQTDARDFGYQQTRDQVRDSQWQQGFGLQGAQLGLSRERLAFEQQNAGLPAGYRRNPDGTMSFVPGGPADPTQVGALSGARGESVKPPSGYRWTGDGQSLEPIPGGPGTVVPAEVGARVGMANSFLEQSPVIRQKIAAGDVTGPWDRTMAANVSSSDQAQVYRQMQSGVDALQRMLTGAGMPASEAAQYAQRYLPGYTDDASSMTSKLDQLTRELQTVERTVTQGRGGPPSQAGGLKWLPDGGIPFSSGARQQVEQRNGTGSTPQAAPDRSAIEAEMRRRGLIP